jgi:uncharacterized membrane protein YhaH (DUF805 family)
MSLWTRPWRHFIDFGGRSRRLEYLFFWVTFYSGILALTMVGSWFAPTYRPGENLGLAAIAFIPAGLFMLAALVPATALNVRRLHDLGISGWWLMIWFVPIIGQLLGWLLSFIIIFIPGPRGENQYGHDPHDPEEADVRNLSQIFS